MSVQRKRGYVGVIFERKRTYNERGVELWEPDFNKPNYVRMVFYSIRSARAEIPGQKTNEEARFIIPEGAGAWDVGSWTVIYWCGLWWDVLAPPQFRESLTRRLQHWTITVRRRPPGIEPAQRRYAKHYYQRKDAPRLDGQKWERLYEAASGINWLDRVGIE